jgi:hypothetical protein
MRTTLRTNCDRRKLELHRAGTNVPRRFWHKGDIATVPNHVRFRRECVELSLRQLMTRHSVDRGGAAHHALSIPRCGPQRDCRKFDLQYPRAIMAAALVRLRRLDEAKAMTISREKTGGQLFDGPGHQKRDSANLVHINMDERIAVGIIRIDAQRGDSSRNCFVRNTGLKQRHVDHSSDTRGLAVVGVKFRLRPTVSAAKMTKVA